MIPTKNSMRATFALCFAGALCATPIGAQSDGAETIAVRGATVYTMAGPPLTDGIVLIGSDGKITAVGECPEITSNAKSDYNTTAVLTDESGDTVAKAVFRSLVGPTKK